MGLVGGRAEGPVAASDQPVSVARIDPADGVLHEAGHVLDGRNLAGSVLVCPTGKGSSSGSYILLNLARRGLAPAAIVTLQADAVLVAGAVLADIPLISGVMPEQWPSLLSAKYLWVDGDAQTVGIA
jgi:predicted aconitase with swiveling domain